MDFSQIIEAFNSLQGKITELLAQLSDAEAFAKAQYDKGFADGVASVPVSNPGDIQAQIDAAVKLAVDPLNEQITQLQTQVSDLQAQLSSVPDQIKAAVLAENQRVMSIVDVEDQDLKSKLQLPE